MPKTLLFILFLLISSAGSQVVHQIYFDRFSHYDVDDWITYAPSTDILTVDIGDDYVYFGTRHGGILRYHLYEHVWEYPFTTSNGLRSNKILALVFNPIDHQLYAKTPMGIDVYNRGFEYWRPALTNEMPARREPIQNNTNNRPDYTDYRFPAYSRPATAALPNFFTDINYVYHLNGEILDRYNRSFRLTDRIVDQWFNFWAGTNGLGVAMGKLYQSEISFYQASIANISPRDMEFLGSDVWIGGKSGSIPPSGICLWRTDNNTWEYFEAPLTNGLNKDDVNVISAHTNNIFFGLDLGLARYNISKNSWKTYTVSDGLESNKVNDLYIHGDVLYIATDAGFNWMSQGYDTIFESSDRTLDNFTVLKITSLDSLILLATRFGLYSYDPQKDKISFFSTKSAVLDVDINAVGVNNDSLWVASRYGITLYDSKTKNWISFPQVNLDLKMVFHDIAFTPGNVWFASDSGLLKYVISRDYWYLYTVDDGLADNHVYHIDVSGEDLWISTRKGITIFRWNRQGRNE
ncbi:MAG: hypothetical protein AB7T22_06730 [Calditrichaceae bacterium]